MALAMRLSRGGRKARPFYRIVVTDKRNARDGRYIERLGTYNPLLPKDDAGRVVLNEERIKHWLGEGAQPSYRVAVFLGKAGLAPMPATPNNPQKGQPSEKTKMRIAEKEEKKKAAAEAAKAAEEEAKAAAEAPAEEAPAEEAAPAEAEASADAPAEEKKED
ncbi:MAG TPA: 30S ribosomal protein S16 [Alphaproteobacteria bacterium]|nr:30S ribosomal protein S16 [Alphaproteobacteria bacterium]